MLIPGQFLTVVASYPHDDGVTEDLLIEVSDAPINDLSVEVTGQPFPNGTAEQPHSPSAA